MSLWWFTVGSGARLVRICAPAYEIPPNGLAPPVVAHGEPVRDVPARVALPRSLRWRSWGSAAATSERRELWPRGPNSACE